MKGEWVKMPGGVRRWVNTPARESPKPQSTETRITTLVRKQRIEIDRLRASVRNLRAGLKPIARGWFCPVDGCWCLPLENCPMCLWVALENQRQEAA